MTFCAPLSTSHAVRINERKMHSYYRRSHAQLAQLAERRIEKTIMIRIFVSADAAVLSFLRDVLANQPHHLAFPPLNGRTSHFQIFQLFLLPPDASLCPPPMILCESETRLPAPASSSSLYPSFAIPPGPSRPYCTGLGSLMLYRCLEPLVAGCCCWYGPCVL